MLLPRFLKIDLRSLILALAVISVMATLSNSFYATYEAQRALLISNTLDANRVYAAKLAEMTNTMLQSSQSQLAYSATLLAPAMKDDSTLLSEMQRLQQQTATFNSVAVVNADAVVVAVYPDTLQVKGARLTSQSAKLSITTRQPVICRKNEYKLVLAKVAGFQPLIRRAFHIGTQVSSAVTQVGHHHFRDLFIQINLDKRVDL